MGEQGSWFERQARKEVGRDRIPAGERGGQLIGIVIIILVALFFYYHQVNNTGFFTADFGIDDAIIFYGALLWGIVPNLIKMITGRRNFARLFEIVGTALTIFWVLWFLNSFPFEFANLAAPLPSSIQFILSWITNDIARLLFILALIGSMIGLFFQVLYYFIVRRTLRTEGKVA